MKVKLKDFFNKKTMFLVQNVAPKNIAAYSFIELYLEYFSDSERWWPAFTLTAEYYIIVARLRVMESDVFLYPGGLDMAGHSNTSVNCFILLGLQAFNCLFSSYRHLYSNEWM